MSLMDIILGRDEQGNVSKVNMALIALLLWRWYQSARQQGDVETAPSPAPIPSPAPRSEAPQQAPIPSPKTGAESDKDFGGLVDSMRRMPDFQRGGGRGRADDGGMGGGLGDILGDILGGGRGMPPGGGRGGGLGDILGDILAGGRGTPGARAAGGPQGDPFSDLLRGAAGAGGLGGLLAGGAAGGVLADLLRQFEQAGRGEAARSWISSGDNMPISPADIENTFGSDIIGRLAEQFGMNKGDLLQGLSEAMPGVIDQLTPDGRLPTQDEILRRA